MSCADRVLTRFEGVRRSGDNWTARCPAHDDRRSSLSVSTGADGRVLLKCHAGCDVDAVLEAVSLDRADLFESKAAKAAVTNEYEYVDENNKLLFTVERRAGKRFVQKRPDGGGGWVYKLDGVRRVPYRLPELLQGIADERWIVIVEGEKDVDKLIDAMFIATCNTGGAGKWRDEWAPMFAGAKVVVIPDNDAPGRKHAEQVVASLVPVAECVKVINLDGLEEHGDVSDWFATGGTVGGLKGLILSAEPIHVVDGVDEVRGDPGTSAGTPEVIDEPGADVLNDLEAFVLRFCAFPTEHYTVAIALWIAHTHCIDAFEITPRLAFVSETKQSGKSRALEVIDLTAAGSRYVAAMSTAYLFRLIDSNKATLLFDEVDTVFGPRARDNEELRALINVGFRRSATIGRCVGDGARQTPTEFQAFAPMALAGIGDCLPDTVLDRSIVLRMRRRAPDEYVESLRYKTIRPQAETLHDRIANWASTHTASLTAANPVMPNGVDDRPADTWEALLAVADAAGGHWPVRARAACLVLNDARAAEDSNISVRLLTDIERTLETIEGPYVFSATLCEALNQSDEESPWGAWNDGKGIQPRDLARRLKGFGIASKKVRIGTETRQGFDFAAFQDTFGRYLPPNRNTRNNRNIAGHSLPDVPDVPDNRKHAEARGTLSPGLFQMFRMFQTGTNTNSTGRSRFSKPSSTAPSNDL